jgi:hypothetical protein
MSSNNQSDGVFTLKRIEFYFNGQSYKFALNPEEYSQSETNRVTVTQTKGGAWVDEFGAGLPTITFKGTTGFKNGTKSGTTGYTKFNELRTQIRDIYDRVSPGTVIPDNKEVYFYNYTDGDYWVVVPKTFELMRTVARPLLYTYNIELICLRTANMPSSNAQGASSTVLGTVVVVSTGRIGQ